MYDGRINIEQRVYDAKLNHIRCREHERYERRRVCASACTWNAVNNAFIVRASRPAQLGSWDFFSDDDDAEGKVQRFGMSTFYKDSAPMNSR